MMKFIFGMQIRIEIFYKLILSDVPTVPKISLHSFAESPEMHEMKI